MGISPSTRKEQEEEKSGAETARSTVTWDERRSERRQLPNREQICCSATDVDEEKTLRGCQRVIRWLRDTAVELTQAMYETSLQDTSRIEISEEHERWLACVLRAPIRHYYGTASMSVEEKKR